MDKIRLVPIENTDAKHYRKSFSDSIVLTHDHKILLQTRSWGPFKGLLTPFGGHVEEGESALHAVIRELNEELGAQVRIEDVRFLGALTEDITQHQDLVNLHFWHDHNKTITGCYEGEPVAFSSADEALATERCMDHTQWALKECSKLGLLT